MSERVTQSGNQELHKFSSLPQILPLEHISLIDVTLSVRAHNLTLVPLLRPPLQPLGLPPPCSQNNDIKLKLRFHIIVGITHMYKMSRL